MTLRIAAKVLIHVWSYDFYAMTLSRGKQRRHMINLCITWACFRNVILHTTVSVVGQHIPEYGQSGDPDAAALPVL